MALAAVFLFMMTVLAFLPEGEPSNATESEERRDDFLQPEEQRMVRVFQALLRTEQGQPLSVRQAELLLPTVMGATQRGRLTHADEARIMEALSAKQRQETERLMTERRLWLADRSEEEPPIERQLIMMLEGKTKKTGGLAK